MTPLDRRNFIRTTAAAGLAALPAGGLAARIAEGAESASGTPSSGSAPPSLALDDPLGVRAGFPVTEELAYLNTASVGPIPIPVRDALYAYADGKMRRQGAGSGPSPRQRAVAGFGGLFGAGEDEVALLYSTTDAENIVASALDWREGDNIVVDELHFVSTYVLHRQLEQRMGVELRVVPSRDGVVTTEDFARRTDARTRLVSVAWVSNRNGFRHDLPALAELAHAHGAYLYADAVQALGTFPVNLRDEGVDFAGSNGYKWLHADFGCAPFFVRREHLEWMAPDRYGHRQVAETLPGRRYRLRSSAARFEYASLANGPVAAMAAALDFLAEVGLDRIAGHTHALASELRDGAEALGMQLFTPPRNPSPIVSFYHGLEHEALAKALADEGIAITFQEEGRLLRAAVAMFNNREDVDRLLGVLARMV
ncbi:MAG: aminotransferase class V-fold PLP-dependent enzyme [Gammaproteobacteria bacterium]|nr:aminotransferase class V-fold PLP-dependent enzyme [Gammaproteobacteria bacterium]